MGCPATMLIAWENEGGSAPKDCFDGNGSCGKCERPECQPKHEGSIDPFLGKCIHGVDGARMSGGVRINPNCKECVADGRAG